MKTVSRFYASLGLLLVLNLLVKPLWIFGIDRPVQNSTGTAIYGSYFALLNLAIVLGFLLDWGLNAFMSRQLAAAPENNQLPTGYFLRLKLYMILLYATVVFMVAFVTGIQQWSWLFLLILIQALTSLFLYARAVLSARQWFRADAFFSVLDKTLMILVCGSFFLLPVAGPVTITKFLGAQALCTGIALLSVLFYLEKKGVVFSFKKVELNSGQFFRSIVPYGLIILLMSAHYRLDGFLLERLHPDGAYQAGIYAGAYRLLDAGNMAGYLLASFLLPFIAKHQDQKKEVNEAIKTTRNFLLLLSASAIAFIVALTPLLQSLLYHDQNPYAIEVLQFCIPALLGYALVQVYGTVLTATGQIRSFCYIVFAALILNTGLNLLLIPAYGALGCCYAALISHSACGITTAYLATRKAGLPVYLRSGLAGILIGAILFCFLYFGKSIIPGIPWLMICAAFLVIGLLYFTRLARPAEWKKIFINN
jgi:O-antigen/teichoic acid export membrane protein